jgi:hypothetical protein
MPYLLVGSEEKSDSPSIKKDQNNRERYNRGGLHPKLSKLLEVKEQFEELQNKYQKYLPKVDADDFNDLLTRQREIL